MVRVLVYGRLRDVSGNRPTRGNGHSLTHLQCAIYDFVHTHSKCFTSHWVCSHSLIVKRIKQQFGLSTSFYQIVHLCDATSIEWRWNIGIGDEYAATPSFSYWKVDEQKKRRKKNFSEIKSLLYSGVSPLRVAGLVTVCVCIVPTEESDSSKVTENAVQHIECVMVDDGRCYAWM